MMRFLFLFLIPLQLSCTIKKDQENQPTEVISETRKEGQASVNNLTVDQPIIIGGYKTRYTLLTRPASSYSIIISHARCADFSGIEQIADMERLRIRLPETSDIDFSPLKSLSKLQYLYISGPALTGIPDLGGIPSLVYLDLDNNSLTSLNGLEKMPQLENLEISEGRKPVTDTSALRYLKGLERLYLGDGSYAVDFANLRDLPKLKDITLFGCEEFDLTGIGRLRQLEKLYLSIRFSEETDKQSAFRNIEEIGKITGLKELYLDEWITSVEFLAGNVNLESLELVSGRHLPDYFTKEFLPLDITPLGNLKKLKYLAIRGFWPGSEQEFDKLLDALPELETINTALFDGE